MSQSQTIARAPRKNLMLSAQLRADWLEVPVRIRNLSAMGAMVDGSSLPDVGASFVLVRQEMSVGAEVVWKRKERCGLRLAEAIDIDEWIAGVRTARRGTSLGQLRVDEVQAALRSGAAMPEPVRAVPRAHGGGPLSGRIAAELAALRQTLLAAGDTLSDDHDVLTRHGEVLQRIDLAAATLAALADVVAAEGSAAAIARIDMHEVRNRLQGTT